MIRKGFTLIELLVVVAVLALLASIVFSNLGGAREGARISNALSFQSQTHSLLGSDLVGWWSFDQEEGSRSNVRDLSGNNNHGTIYGSTPESERWVEGIPGTFGYSLSFNGTNDYVSGSLPPIGIGKPFTLSSWFKTSTSFAYQPGIVAMGYSPVIVMRTDGRIGAWWYNGTSYPGVNSIKSHNDGSFHQVILTYNGVTATLYIDGEYQSSIESNIHSIYSGFNVGREHNNGNKIFLGLIDDVRIYSRALTAGEIQILYAQTKEKHLANE